MAEVAGSPFIAVDWGTTRLRATLVGPAGEILGRAASDSGVQSVAPGGYAAALETACGPWLAAHPEAPVIMAGMVGSRNGWVEVPYVPPPCGVADLAARLHPVPGSVRPIHIVPGVDCRSGDGGYDVMRGEETQALGTGVRDGLVCLPGTHSKWVAMASGRITCFVTFATGELYAALQNSFVGRLAAEPDDSAAGAEVARVVAAMPGGLTRQVFQARTQVLGGGLSGQGVRPFLSGLLIEAEVAGVRDLFGSPGSVTLVAAEPQLSLYRAVLERHGFAVTAMPTEDATLGGLKALAAASNR